MLFLDIWSDLFNELGDIIDWMLSWLFFFIAKIIYPFIIYLYNLFEVLAKGRLLDNDIMETLSGRIGLLLGIVMFFIVIINVIQMLVDPDKINDKEKGAAGIITRVLTVIVLFAISSFAFNTAYYVQGLVIDSQIIGKLIIPDDNVDENGGFNNFGEFLSYELFTAFYTINPNVDLNSTDCDEMLNEDLRDDVRDNQKFFSRDYNSCLNMEVNGEKVIEFNWILSVLVAGFCIYFLFTYCVTVGVRMIQLTFLEIMSPMAFVAYLSPKKDNMFSKWLKLYTSTFIDSILRIAIISFAVYLISLILGEMSEGMAFYDTVMNNEVVRDYGWMATVFIYIVMIFAILTFAKKAPDLIKELFPAGAAKLGLGMTSPKQLFDGMLGGNVVRGGLVGAAGLGIGAAIGGIGNAIRGGINDKENRLRGIGGGLLGGLTSGGLAGARAKGIGKAFGASNKAATDQSRRIAEWRATGGTSTFGRWGSNLQQKLGITTKGEKETREEQILNDYIKLQDTIEGYAENNSKVKELKRRYEQIQNAGRIKFYDADGNITHEESDDEFNTRIENARNDYKAAMKAVVNAGMKGRSGTNAATYRDSAGNDVSFDVESGVSDSIKFTTEKLNRDIKNNGLDKKGYGSVSNHKNMDDQTIKARADVAKLTSTAEYASHKADDKYNGSNNKK